MDKHHRQLITVPPRLPPRYRSPETVNRKHLFFLFAGEALNAVPPTRTGILSIPSKELAHRIYNVLRLQPGEKLQLFSSTLILTVSVLASPRPKDTFCAEVESAEKITHQAQKTAVAIGFLKKESFEEAAHHAAVTGASEIIPLITAKSRRAWLHENEKIRLESIIVAACEQAKNPHIPRLGNPQKLESCLRSYESWSKIAFEAGSAHPLKDIGSQSADPDKKNILFFGPEGGFTTEEEAFLEQEGTLFYRLTPTILRTQEAVCLAVGFFNCS